MPDLSSSLSKSIILHLAIFLVLLLAGLEIFARKPPEEAFIPISVEILNVTDRNNIPKAQVAAKKPKPKPKKPPKPPKPKVKVIPLPDAKPEVKPTPKVDKPKEKPVEKPKEKPKPPVDELESLLKSLEQEQQAF